MTSEWVKKNGREDSGQDVLKMALGSFPGAAAAAPSMVESVDFNQTEYDPATVTAANPVVVSLTLKLKKDIDQQQTVMVNGTLIKRARDGFGRAVTSGGSGGLLESTSLSVNTWVPVSARTILLNLDGVMFGGQFPQIILASPKSTYDLSKELFALSSSNCPPIVISGQLVADTRNCLDRDTPIAYKKAVVRPISVVRVLQGIDGPVGTPRVMFTDLGAASTTGAQTTASATDIRVVSSSGLHYWSGATEVYFESASGLTHLSCDAAVATGSKLICNLPGNVTDASRFLLVDRAHTLDSSSTVGPIKGWASLGSCVTNADPKLETCKIPTFSEISGPAPTSDGTGWEIAVKFINLNEAKTAFPMSAELGSSTFHVSNLVYPGPTNPLEFKFTLKPAQLSGDIQDSMTLTLTNNVGGKTKVQLANILSNLEPKATTIATDYKTFSGTNLIADFTQLRVGDSKTLHGIKCNGGNTCQLNVGEDLKKEAKGGYVFLIPQSAPATSIALMTTQTGVTTFATYTPPAPPKAGSDQEKPASSNPTINFSPQIVNQVNAGTAPVVGTQNVTNPTAAPIKAPPTVVPPAPAGGAPPPPAGAGAPPTGTNP